MDITGSVILTVYRVHKDHGIMGLSNGKGMVVLPPVTIRQDIYAMELIAHIPPKIHHIFDDKRRRHPSDGG